jgi:hypothetical protein
MAASQQQLDHTAKWIPELAAMWHEEIPLKIHAAGFDAGGNPRWDPYFAEWLMGGRGGENSPRRARLTHAMRRLRRFSIREYEVAYRIIVLGERIEHTTDWLNERAIRNGKPERYRLRDTEVIICSAVHKLLEWY